MTLLVIATLCAIALYAGVGVNLTHAAAGDIYNLGTLGGSQSLGFDINNTGQVTGNSYTTAEAEKHAFRYDGTPGGGGAMFDLGTLGGGESTGNAINAAGQVAGDSYTSYTLEEDAALHAFRYTGTPGSGGAMADLGTLGGGESTGRDINAAGQVVGDADTIGGVRHAYRTAPNAVINPVTDDLGTLGGTTSIGIGINAAGQVAGASDTLGDAALHAFRYTGTPGAGGAMVDLGTLGGTISVGTDINAAGQVAGASDTLGDAAVHAFRYSGTPGSGGAMVDLGTLGGTISTGIDINEAGFVVGYARRSAGTDVWATLWQIDAGNTAVDLDAWLDATNPTLGAFWTLTVALGINDNGLITGYGFYDDGAGGLIDQRAYILDASSLVVPEPATLALLAFGLPLIMWRDLRRSGTSMAV
ncbi:MAG: hypothetical protein WD738_02175 [Pirellulales bacterium]